MSSTPELRRSGPLALTVGVVALEFAAAVSSFVGSTLLPTINRELHARDHLGLLLAGSVLGLFGSAVGGRVGATGPGLLAVYGVFAVLVAGAALAARRGVS